MLSVTKFTKADEEAYEYEKFKKKYSKAISPDYSPERYISTIFAAACIPAGIGVLTLKYGKIFFPILMASPLVIPGLSVIAAGTMALLNYRDELGLS